VHIDTDFVKDGLQEHGLVCVCVREREHTNMDLETVIANELTHHGVLGFNPKLNRKLFHDHLPSIFMVCLWVPVHSGMKGVPTNESLGFPIAQHDS
jgi:hypothetical protein